MIFTRILCGLGLMGCLATAQADTIAIDVGSTTGNIFTTRSSVPGQGTNNTTINVGDTVTWTWRTGFHNVTAMQTVNGTPVFKSNTTSTVGNTFSQVFSTPGSVCYYCSIHGVPCAGMSGVLTVQTRISGTVMLPSYSSVSVPVTFQFRPKAGGTVLTQTATLGTDRTFQISNIPAGVYDVAVKGAIWLQQVVTNVDTTAGNVTGLSFTLPPGDANNDNRVDTLDFNTLIGAFGGSGFDPATGYDPSADFNGDGAIDTADFNLIVGEFGNVGAN